MRVDSEDRMFAALIFVLIGFVLGMVVVTLLNLIDRPKRDHVSVNNISCQFCHAPVFKTAKEYGAYHRFMRDEVLRAELVKSVQAYQGD